MPVRADVGGQMIGADDITDLVEDQRLQQAEPCREDEIRHQEALEEAPQRLLCLVCILSHLLLQKCFSAVHRTVYLVGYRRKRFHRAVCYWKPNSAVLLPGPHPLGSTRYANERVLHFETTSGSPGDELLLAE